MRTVIKLTMAMLMLIAAQHGYAHYAYDFMVDGIYYNVVSSEDHTAEVTSNSGGSYNTAYQGEVVIPSTVSYGESNYTVEGIGSCAFSGCEGLRSVILPSTVKYIDWGAFYDCRNLVSLQMPEALEYIKDRAFSGCSSLVGVAIPETVTYIGKEVFNHCSGLRSVTIPKSVTFIGDDVFLGCYDLQGINVDPDNEYYSSIEGDLYNKDATSLIRCVKKRSMTVPGTVLTIDTNAFRGCQVLVSVTMPASVKTIGARAFEDCPMLEEINVDPGNTVYSSIDGNLYNKDATSLIRCAQKTVVTLPGSVETIEDYAFRGCTRLTSVALSNSVKSIGINAFANCSDLVSVTNLNSVKTIGAYAFYCCTNLTSVADLNSVETIGEYAFCRCAGLTSMTLPNSVETIGEYAFYRCASLTSVTIPESLTWIRKCTFEGCTGLSVLTMPNTLQQIDEYAFMGCEKITSITIPESVGAIGRSAFYINALKSVYVQREIPIDCPISGNPFSYDIFPIATLYVPVGTIDNYQHAYPWHYFEHMEEYAYNGIGGICDDNAGDISITLEDGILSINGLGINEEVSLFDMHGRVVYRGAEHSVTGLHSGMYIIKAPGVTAKVVL